MSETLDMEIMQPTQSAIEQIERAQVDIQISTAHRFPRNIVKVKNEIVSMATMDIETAASCFYTLPRSKKVIQGESIRLAEIAMACYGNMRVAARIASVVTTGDNTHVVIEAMAHDLEKNTAFRIEKRRRIIGKWDKEKNVRKPIDEDDINLSVAGASAIAIRDAILKVVPKALIKPAYEAAKRVAVGDAKSLAERRQKCVETFAKMGIDEKRVLGYVNKTKVEEIGLEELEELIGLFNALRDGHASIDDAFPEQKKDAPAPAKPEFTPPPPVEPDQQQEPQPKKEDGFELSDDPLTPHEKLYAELKALDADSAMLVNWLTAKKILKSGQGVEDMTAEQITDVLGKLNDPTSKLYEAMTGK